MKLAYALEQWNNGFKERKLGRNPIKEYLFPAAVFILNNSEHTSTCDHAVSLYRDANLIVDFIEKNVNNKQIDTKENMTNEAMEAWKNMCKQVFEFCCLSVQDQYEELIGELVSEKLLDKEIDERKKIYYIT